MTAHVPLSDRELQDIAYVLRVADFSSLFVVKKLLSSPDPRLHNLQRGAKNIPEHLIIWGRFVQMDWHYRALREAASNFWEQFPLALAVLLYFMANRTTYFKHVGDYLMELHSEKLRPICFNCTILAAVFENASFLPNHNRLCKQAIYTVHACRLKREHRYQHHVICLSAMANACLERDEQHVQLALTGIDIEYMCDGPDYFDTIYNEVLVGHYGEGALMLLNMIQTFVRKHAHDEKRSAMVYGLRRRVKRLQLQVNGERDEIDVKTAKAVIRAGMASSRTIIYKGIDMHFDNYDFRSHIRWFLFGYYLEKTGKRQLVVYDTRLLRFNNNDEPPHWTLSLQTQCFYALIRAFIGNDHHLVVSRSNFAQKYFRFMDMLAERNNPQSLALMRHIASLWPMCVSKNSPLYSIIVESSPMLAATMTSSSSAAAVAGTAV
jgi:hypothetical protein